SDPGGRTAWNLALLREVRASAGELFPPLGAARLAAQKELLPRLTVEELRELAEPLAGTFPRQTSEQLAWGELPYPALTELLAVCRRGLSGPPEAAGWAEVCEQPDRWETASRVALDAAAAASGRRDALVSSEVIELLAAASDLTDPGAGPISTAEADARLRQALGLVCAAGPAGSVDDALRSAARLERSAPLLITGSERQHLITQACGDASRRGPDSLLLALLRSGSLSGLFAASDLS
ncbi:MAG: hypothetical protein M3O15_01810, partial [Acidobacteriota bacterium]|nr:hypothetical protein [Acidobacteriota bacterium]